MKYDDGTTISVGDKVALGGDMYGVVVASIEDHAYSEGYSEEEWGFLRHGVLVESREAGVVHYPKETSELTLVEKKSNSPL